MKGYVYAVQKGTSVKIGRSGTPKRRIRNIETQSGFILDNVYISEPKYLYAKVETECHSRLDNSRIVGEWFDVDFNTAVSCIKSVINDVATKTAEDSELIKREKFSNVANNYFKLT